MAVSVRNWENKDFNIRVFPSKNDMVEAAEEAYDYLKSKKVKPNGKTLATFYKKSKLDNMKNEKFYEDTYNLEKGLEFFDKLLVETDMGGAFKKSRLRITDDTKGIFDFGLASQALYRSIEYFSKELEVESPDEFKGISSGIVPNKYVMTKKIFNVTSFQYTSSVTSKTYDLIQQQEGTKEMLLLNPNAIIKTTDAGLKYAYPSSFQYIDNGKKKTFNLKFKTRNKKSYLIFEKKGGKAKMIELYFPIHKEVSLANILPMLLVAKYLQQAGVQTRINVLRMYFEKSDLFVMYGYPIIDYGEVIDFNEIALNGVDDRWWEAMRVMVRTLNDTDNFKNLGGYNSRFYQGAGDPAGSAYNYVEVFSRYRNWYMDQIDKGLMPPLRIDKKLILFGGVFGGYGSYDYRKKDIIKEFFRILDTVDFQFNNAQETCKRIYKRMVDDRLAEFYQKRKMEVSTVTPIQPLYSTTEIVGLMEEEKKRLVYDFKKYVQNLLLSTYSYPLGGMYEEPEESARKLDEEFDEKNEELDKFLKTI
jgi:hypothetical protein